MAARDTIQNSVKKAIGELEKRGKLPPASFDIKVDKPQRKDFGDYSVSVAMQIAASANRKPKTVAKIIHDELLKDEKLKNIVSDIRVAPPGFVNFYLSENHLRLKLYNIFTKDLSSNINTGRGAKINIEFGSINPTGELHVGHARTFFYGDVLANILEFAGFDVTREYYINNARQSSQIKELGKTALGEGTSYKGPYLNKKIKQYSKALGRMKSYEAAGYFIAGKIQKNVKKFLENEAEIKFDTWTEEEELYKKGEVKKTLEEFRRRDLVYEEEGALWLKTTKYGDKQDQVLVRSSGENTYFLTDIAYHRYKARRRYKKMIDIWGADHHGHVQRMRAALKVLGIGNVEILIAQFVRLRGGAKLSKRKGTIVTIEDLIDAVGIGAVRFFYLTKSLDSQMEFDIKLAREQSQKNPVYYIQYTHARICGIMRKSKNDKIEITKKDLQALRAPGEFDLARKLNDFSDIVESAAEDYQVHRLANYVLELAQEFNQFYRDFKVLTEDEKTSKARRALAAASGMVIGQCLELLGIEAPDRM